MSTMSGKPLIPSKDALRVLRSLAQSPSAAFLGTAGALCGVAVVHYHERRRVRLAQQIVDTKRTLHSISNGRGTAKLASMFEAAERGEDFTMRRDKRRRMLGRRKHSVMATQSEQERDAAWRPFCSSEKISTPLPMRPDNERPESGNTSRRQDAAPVPGFDKRVLGEKPQDSDRRWHIHQLSSTSYQKKEKKLPLSYHERAAVVRSKTMKQATTIDRLPTPEDGIVQSTPPRASQNLMEQTPYRSSPTISILQAVTDLSRVAREPLSKPERKSLVTGSDDSPSILLNVNAPRTVATDGFGSLQPWQSVIDDNENDKVNIKAEASSGNDTVGLDLYISSSADVPIVTTQHQSRSRYDLANPKVLKGMSMFGAGRYKYVFTRLMNFRQQHGTEASLVLLEQIMKTYTATDRKSDFALVQALFLDCTKSFSTSSLKPIVHRYVERFLDGEAPRLEVVSLLYPNCGAETTLNRQYYYFLAHQYLETIREKGYSLDRQVLELRKVLAGTHMLEIGLHEHLMIPALRSLCIRGRMTAAQALFDEMTTVHKVIPTFYSLEVLVQGYARAGNWSKVKALFGLCHTGKFAHQKVYGLSSLLTSIIKDYAAVQPVERVLEFVTHSIREYGMQPVSNMTREVVCLCLRERRYDLVVNWIDMVRTDFPHIDLGTGSSTFALEVSCVWRDIDASCDDIYDGCKAIADQALRDPFSKVFRSTASGAAAHYMQPKLDELRKILGADVPNVPTGELGQFCKAMRQLQEHEAMRSAGSRTRLMLNHLIDQGEVLRWLNALFQGSLQSDKSVFRIARSEEVKKSRAVEVVRLPHFAELQDTLMKQYVQQHYTGQPIQHQNLRQTVAQLTQQGRKPHAFDLIQAVHDSRWAQPLTGTEFDLEVYVDWLRLAMDIKSGSKVRSVLWAIIDAGPQLKLDSRIVLLARVAAPKTHLQRAKDARMYEVEEVEYLRLRLRRRLWATSPVKAALRFDHWQGFGSSSVHHEVC